MVSSSRRRAASGASLLSGMVARVGVPSTEPTAPRLSSGGANCTGLPVGGGKLTGGPVGGGKFGPGG